MAIKNRKLCVDCMVLLLDTDHKAISGVNHRPTKLHYKHDNVMAAF